MKKNSGKKWLKPLVKIQTKTTPNQQTMQSRPSSELKPAHVNFRSTNG